MGPDNGLLLADEFKDFGVGYVYEPGTPYEHYWVVIGCMTLLGCEDLCPKNLPLAAQIAFLRRRMAAVRS